ncbi:MAG: ABC transporter ATP-binding protein, partial [Yaniella sp.]|nr:ABC transporter ATP-binding protein [Yaniella sp.]MDN6758086.1 ABC transporter ATP-binding protein [Yaniella sp.]
DPNRVSAVLKAVLLDGLNPLDTKTEHGPAVLVAGYEYGAAPAALRRELVGMASDRLPLERGSVQRLASYRLPKISADEVRWMLHRVGLTAQIVAHPKGVKALLKNDGETWSRSDVARLKIARALLGNPSLVVLENIDAALDEQGLIMLRKLLDEYPGTVLFSSLVPQRLFAESEMRRWPLDG